MTWIRISDARFLGRIVVHQSKWWIRVDSSIPLVNFGPSDLGWLILIQTIPNEHSLFLSGTFSLQQQNTSFTCNRLRVDYYLFLSMTGGDQMLIGFAFPRSFRYFFCENYRLTVLQGINDSTYFCSRLAPETFLFAALVWTRLEVDPRLFLASTPPQTVHQESYIILHKLVKLFKCTFSTFMLCAPGYLDFEFRVTRNYQTFQS